MGLLWLIDRNKTKNEQPKVAEGEGGQLSAEDKPQDEHVTEEAVGKIDQQLNEKKERDDNEPQ